MVAQRLRDSMTMGSGPRRRSATVRVLLVASPQGYALTAIPVRLVGGVDAPCSTASSATSTSPAWNRLSTRIDAVHVRRCRDRFITETRFRGLDGRRRKVTGTVGCPSAARALLKERLFDSALKDKCVDLMWRAMRAP
jgi:hypothetical protein